jgi:hypothetical protein
MTELLREEFVDRQDKFRKEFNGIPNDPIRVSFYDIDGTRVNDVTRKEANSIAAANPSQLFYFQDKNRIQQELSITQVNSLVPSSNLKAPPTCNTGAKPSGSPVLNVFGGEGLGVLANTIISPISSGVIGFDIINGGKNYIVPPFAQLIDEFGKGSGSKLETEISNGSVTQIKIKAPGDGYLAAPDGSFGGGGRTIKKPNQGLVQKPDGTYIVVPPNVSPELEPGDTFIPPSIPPTITPTITPSIPPIITPTYPVVLEIDDVDIDNPGFGYQPGDNIIVTPDRGAVLEPVIDKGRIIKINVISPGIGFDDFPQITTNSPTGYNLSARPIFRVRRLNEEQSFIPPPGATIISVVDCVGIVPPKKEFDRVPR